MGVLWHGSQTENVGAEHCGELERAERLVLRRRQVRVRSAGDEKAFLPIIAKASGSRRSMRTKKGVVT